SVRLWDIGTPGAPLLTGTFGGHRDPVQAIAFAPDGSRLASASQDGTIGVWDTHGTTLGGTGNPSIELAFSPDGATLAVSTFGATGGVVRLYAMPARRLAGTLPVGHLATLAFSPDSKTLATGLINGGGIVALWNVATRAVTGTLHTGLQSAVR